MQIPKRIIEKAIEGGWLGVEEPKAVRVQASNENEWWVIKLNDDTIFDGTWTDVFADRTFWQALGKALGWEGRLCPKCSHRAEQGLDRVKTHLLLTRYAPSRVVKGEMLSHKDVIELLGIDFIGAIPESPAVLQSSNAGVPIILDQQSDAAQAYMDVVHRFLGEDRPQRFLDPPKRGFFSRMFGGADAPVAAAG